MRYRDAARYGFESGDGDEDLSRSHRPGPQHKTSILGRPVQSRSSARDMPPRIDQRALGNADLIPRFIGLLVLESPHVRANEEAEGIESH